MTNKNKQIRVKIPGNVNLFYFERKKSLLFKGPQIQRSLKIKTKIFISPVTKEIIVSSLPFVKLSSSENKKNKAIQGTTVSLIKQCIIETSSVLYKKLNFIGVGYRVFPVENFKNHLLLFKLGYSHQIYFKIPLNLKMHCLKLTKLFIYGNSYQNLTQTAFKIRSNKFPEPYKGKGILYEGEKIILKEGKKI